MEVRLTRAEQKERTRSEVIRAARQVFLRRGFHGASLDEIAEQAGYTKGAVYSNFASKDALFLAVLEEHYEKRIEAYARMLEGESIDETFRAISQFMADADAREPDWLPLLAEFTSHAARQELVRHAYVQTRERFLEAIARIIETLAKRHGFSQRVSPLEAARGSSVLARGFSAERQLDPDAVTPELFVELHTAYLHGLTIPAKRRNT
jgi:AcrR family transcriptional regulator